MFSSLDQTRQSEGKERQNGTHGSVGQATNQSHVPTNVKIGSEKFVLIVWTTLLPSGHDDRQKRERGRRRAYFELISY